MKIPSLEFLLALSLLVAVFHSLPNTKSRRSLLGFCNLAFVWFALPNLWTRAALLLFALSGYGVARILQTRPRQWILSAYTASLVLTFVVLKKYEFLAVLLPARVLAHPVEAVGLSYMLFRQIHFLVDVFQQQIPAFSLSSFLNYQFNLFGFISGPIQRYQEFDRCWRDLNPLVDTRHDLLELYLRIFVGIIKISLISTYFLENFEGQRAWFAYYPHILPITRIHVLRKFLVYFYSYLPYLYFNFSGWCDIMIAAAALVGIEMPENFDQPYLSRNVSDYWTRFHRSLGFWIRDYLFTPLYKASATRWSSQAQWLVFPCYFVAFVLAGIWHGSTLNFAVFGLLHGIGVSVAKMWEYWILKHHGRKGLKAYLASPAIRIVAIVVTLHFVAFTMLFFPQSVGSAIATFRNFALDMKR